MRLIIGGAYQGKRRYAEVHYGTENIMDNFHLFILDLLNRGINPIEYVREHLESYRGMVIISDDISCGIVPSEPELRRWREAVGEALVFLAGESDEVVRVFCGLGVQIK